MKYIYLLLTTFFASISPSQNYSKLGVEDDIELGFLERDFETYFKSINPNKRIRKIITTNSQNKKDTFVLLLSPTSKLISIKDKRRYSPLPFATFVHREFEYNNISELVESRSFTKKGRLNYMYLYEYFSPTKKKEVRFFQNNKLKNREVFKYNTDSSLKSYIFYCGNHNQQKAKYSYEYDYYSKQEIKQIRYYNSKNSVKRIWNYDCDKKGKIEDKKEMQVCKNTGTDIRGYSIETIFSSNIKGSKSKTTSTYYMFNGKKIQVRLEKFEYNRNKEYRTLDIHFADSLEPFYEITRFEKNGNIYLKDRVEYSMFSASKKIVSANHYSFYSRNKPKWQSKSNFNNNGFLVERITHRKNKPISKTTFTLYGDSIVKKSVYNKKMKLKSETTPKINYY